MRAAAAADMAAIVRRKRRLSLVRSIVTEKRRLSLGIAPVLSELAVRQLPLTRDKIVALRHIVNGKSWGDANFLAPAYPCSAEMRRIVKRFTQS